MQIHEASLGPNVRKPKKDWARTPEQEAQFQKMQAKCRKNAAKVEVDGSSGGDSETQTAGVALNPSLPMSPSAAECNSPLAAAPLLIWNRKSKYAMQSGCTAYEIHKEVIGNCSRNGINISDGKWVYWCWRKVHQLWYVKFSPYVESFEAAKAICEKHARENPIGKRSAA